MGRAVKPSSYPAAAGKCLRTVDEVGYGLTAAFCADGRHVAVGTKAGRLEIVNVDSGVVAWGCDAHQGPLWSLCQLPDKTGAHWSPAVSLCQLSKPRPCHGSSSSGMGNSSGGMIVPRRATGVAAGLVTGSADKEVKVWEFVMEEVEEDGAARSRLACKNTRTLKLSDDVLCVRCSPNNKFLACSLLDSTIKVFFLDSFKFYLSLVSASRVLRLLAIDTNDCSGPRTSAPRRDGPRTTGLLSTHPQYGHRLPALCMDISSDSTLLVSGSADKNVKIWGLDFGDCHKSFFAHDDSVMQVTFVPRTHYAFSCGRDGALCYWDCDKFHQLLVLRGHYGECWALAVGAFGDLVVTGGHDRSIRRWERTDEPFFVEEEKEKRLESMFEETLAAEGGAVSARACVGE